MPTGFKLNAFDKMKFHAFLKKLFRKFHDLILIKLNFFEENENCSEEIALVKLFLELDDQITKGDKNEPQAILVSLMTLFLSFFSSSLGAIFP